MFPPAAPACFSLPDSSGVPTVLLEPDSGVPDLEPGLGRPWGYLLPLGVNMVPPDERRCLYLCLLWSVNICNNTG